MLVRAAHHSDVLEVELTARGIPFVKYGGLRFTEAAHVKDFLAAARVVANPADDIGWFRVLRLHEGIGPAHRPADDRGAAARRSSALRTLRQPRSTASRPGPGAAVAATLAALAAAATWTARRTGPAPILAALADPLRARYPDAAARIADLERLADAAAEPALAARGPGRAGARPAGLRVRPGRAAAAGRRLT